MRILRHPTTCLGDLHLVQPFQRHSLRSPARQTLMRSQNLFHLVLHLQVRCQSRQRVLKDHRDIATAHRIQFWDRRIKHLTPHQLHRTRRTPILGHQPHRSHKRLAFARPALAHNSKTLARIDIERHALYRRNHSVWRIKFHFQIAYGKQAHLSDPSGLAHRANHRR